VGELAPKTSSIISAPVVITGRNSRRYTTSVVRVEARRQPGDLLDADPAIAHQADE
jgi:hypothetical protein